MGKGGVGKTTVSAAYAAWLAQRHRTRVLLLSTDPAHSLSDVLEVKLGHTPKPIAGGRLHAWELDAKRRFSQFLNKYRRPLGEIIEAGTIFAREEIEPLLESTLPGMSEVAALLAIDDAVNSGNYEHVVVDTAPFGHTLRLLQMPQAFARLLRFLEIAASRDQVLAAHFGGRISTSAPPLIAQWQELLEQIISTIRDSARLILVTTPEPFAINESVRVALQMKKLDPPLRFAEAVVNRVVRRAGSCQRCGIRHKQARAAVAFLRRAFLRIAVRTGDDPGEPILGLDHLVEFGGHVFESKRSSGHLSRKGRALVRLEDEAQLHDAGRGGTRGPRLKATSWPSSRMALTLTVGKGGVGKTTISAALAFRMREREKVPIAICSTDPAPSLDDVFGEPIGDDLHAVFGDPKLQAAEIDAAGEFQRWAAQVKRSVRSAVAPTVRDGLHVDLSFERELFEALLDIVPPGVDEIFSVLRLSELVAGKAMPRSRLIIDMAPTGHALELLRTPDRILHWSRLLLKTLATHRTLPLARDLGAEIAMMASRVRQLARSLADARHTSVIVVALPEPLPDRETGRLLRELQALQLQPVALFVNRVLFAEDAAKCGFCRSRSAWQMISLRRLKREAGNVPLLVVREQATGIAGRHALQAFTRELWTMQ